MSGYPRWRRRKFLIDKRIQHRFIWLLTLQVGIITLIIGLFSFRQMMETRQLVEGALAKAEVQVEILNKILDGTERFVVHTAILILVIIIAVYAIGIFASHKIAGPVFKLKKHMTILGGGNFSAKIAFRKKDKLDEFAQILNETMNSLFKRQETAVEGLKKLASIAENYSKDMSLKKSEPIEANEFLENIRLTLKELDDCL